MNPDPTFAGATGDEYLQNILNDFPPDYQNKSLAGGHAHAPSDAGDLTGRYDAKMTHIKIKLWKNNWIGLFPLPLVGKKFYTSNQSDGSEGLISGILPKAYHACFSGRLSLISRRDFQLNQP